MGLGNLYFSDWTCLSFNLAVESESLLTFIFILVAVSLPYPTKQSNYVFT